jgi:N-acetylglucosamine-6-phosphate deacetylase
VMVRAKGWQRSILVTDAVAAADSRPGLHPFAGMAVELQPDGTVRQPGSSVLAGSSLTLDQAVRNVMAWGLGTWRQALSLACAHPRRLLIERGVRLPASEIVWSPDHRPVRVRLGSLVREMPARGDASATKLVN